MNGQKTVVLQIGDRSWLLVAEVERDRYALPGAGRAASAESEALHIALGWAMVSDGWPLLVDGKPAAVLFFGEVRVSEDCVISLSLRWREREAAERIAIGAPPPPDPVAERRAREAQLVALVAAVPSWADPVAWRAAVLAYVEQGPEYRSALLGSEGVQRDFTAAIRTVHAANGRPVIAFNYGSGCRAYARALAPSAAVRPEWRERLPHGLACNAHEVL